MATGTIILPVLGASLDSANPPGLAFSQSRPKLLFDDTTPQLAYWVFRMPANYASGLVAKIQYSMASAVANEVDFEVSVMAVTDADAQDLDSDSYDTANSGSATVPGTAGYLDEISVTLSNADSVAAGDWVALRLARDADDATNDDATGDAEVWNVSLEYTTS
jgi:hypothetical protein